VQYLFVHIRSHLLSLSLSTHTRAHAHAHTHARTHTHSWQDPHLLSHRHLDHQHGGAGEFLISPV